MISVTELREVTRLLGPYYVNGKRGYASILISRAADELVELREKLRIAEEEIKTLKQQLEDEYYDSRDRDALDGR